MNKFKICVYAICKNEEKFVDKWVESMSEADIIVVTDTGSTDQTVEKLRKKGVIVYDAEINPWRFDNARNISLENVPDDVDICVCTDLDELFEKGWRKKLEDTWVPGSNMANYIFNWSLHPDGSPDVQLVYFKIHTKKDYTWTCPIHEYLKYNGNPPEKKVFVDGMVLNHYPDHTKSRGSYLPMLEMAAEETPMDDRIIYYLGREYKFMGQWQKCIETLEKYLLLPTATWKDERCSAMRLIARSYYELNKVKEAYSWYYSAIEELPGMRDAYIEFAKVAYCLGDWATVWFFSEQALKIKEKSMTYTNMGYAWDFTPNDLASIGAYRLKMYDKSLEHAKLALSFAPSDKRLQNNIVEIKNKIQKLKSK